MNAFITMFEAAAYCAAFSTTIVNGMTRIKPPQTNGPLISAGTWGISIIANKPTMKNKGRFSSRLFFSMSGVNSFVSSV